MIKKDQPPSDASSFFAMSFILALALLKFLALPNDCVCFRIRFRFRLGLLLLSDVGAVDITEFGVGAIAGACVGASVCLGIGAGIGAGVGVGVSVV